jgi:hypothetical protein
VSRPAPLALWSWYVASVRRGPIGFQNSHRAVSAVCWLGLVAAPVLAVLGVVLAVVLAWWWLLVGGVLAVLAVLPALALSVLKSRIAHGKPIPAWVAGRRTGKRGTSPELKLAAAVGGRKSGVEIAPHAAVVDARVTIVVACFNDAHFLGAALHSVASQTIADWQCVVVDDDSTDESYDVALMFAEVDRRFTVVRHDRNRGLSAARNTGLALATGTYSTFLDSDDFLYAGSLERRLAAVTTDPSCVGAYCDWRSVPETAAYRAEHASTPATRAPVHLMTAGFDVPFIASAPIVRTDVMRVAGGFDETLPTAEDADMWSRLLRGGVWLAYAGYVGVAYRQRRMSMVRRSPLGHLDVVTGVTRRLAEAAPDVWAGAPTPLAAPLGELMREGTLASRQLNFVALHVALHGPDGVQQQHLPSAAARSLPGYRDLALDQARRALQRAGTLEPGAAEALAAQLLELAPPPTAPLELPVTAPAGEIRGRVLRAAPRVHDVASLRDGEPVLLLVPQARYHVAEIGPLYESLRDRGVECRLYLPPEAAVAVRRELSAYTDDLVVGDPDALVGAPLTGAVVLNDWGPSTSAVLAAVRAAGGVSFAKVEGVQDFQDVDTGRVREPYRHSDVVLAQGGNDVAALPGRECVVVGSSRLETIHAAPAVPADSGRVLINLNFTYGVLADAQDAWLWAAVNGARELGLDYEISAHPSQKQIPRDAAIQTHLSSDPFSHALRRSSILVSRFSTVLFEAMALGVPVIYLNSHGERVPTFANPDGAFLHVTEPSLTEPLREALTWCGDYRTRSDAFFRAQVDIDPERSSAERAADLIAERVAR